MLLTLLIVVCAITYTFEIVFGLAGTIMMVTVMSFFMDAKTLVIYSLLPQVLVATIGLARSPKTVELAVLGRMLMFAALGSVVGLALFYYFSQDLFKLLLASAITFFGGLLVLVPGRLRLKPAAASLLDTVAGASQALFGISGPIAMTRLLSTFKEKMVIRNYALAFFLSTNLMRAGGYVVNGTITPEILRMMAISTPFLVVTLWYSNHLHFKVNEKLFKTTVAWIILLGGISMLLS
jgi:uncharacterized membrane protein YfcA